MPVARKANETPAVSERLQLATAISKFTASQESYLKSAEALNQFKSEMFTELDLLLETKKTELNELEIQYKNALNEGRIDTEFKLKEFRRDGAVNLLKEFNEVPINADELASLRDAVKTMTASHSEEITAIRKEERERSDAALHSAITNLELKHKAEVAENTAAVKQQQKEIDSLNRVIINLQNELAEQRKLTKDVAEAGRQGAVTVNSGSRS